MFIAYVYYKGDTDKLENFLWSVERCECTHNKYLFLNTDGSENSETEMIKRIIPDAECVSINALHQNWPGAVNESFIYVMEEAERRQEDFLFLDADCLVLGKNTFDIMYDEFLQKNCRTMGCLVQDIETIRDAMPEGLKERCGGMHTLGIAFYSWAIKDALGMIYNCPAHVSYDIWCKEGFLSYFSGTYYMNTPGRYENMDSLDSLGTCLLFHGIKDDSLRELIESENFFSQTPVIAESL